METIINAFCTFSDIFGTLFAKLKTILTLVSTHINSKTKLTLLTFIGAEWAFNTIGVSAFLTFIIMSPESILTNITYINVIATLYTINIAFLLTRKARSV